MHSFRNEFFQHPLTRGDGKGSHFKTNQGINKVSTADLQRSSKILFKRVGSKESNRILDLD